MKKILLLMVLSTMAKAGFVYQGSSPLAYGDYNVAVSPAITMSFKNTGASVDSISPVISGANSSDFKVSLNRCSNISPNKLCSVSLVASSKSISLGSKSISFNGASINLNVVKLDANGQPIVAAPPATEALSFEPSSLSEFQFSVGEKLKTVSFSLKNTGTATVTPSFNWSSNSANVSMFLNRCSVALKPNATCSISVRIPAPANNVNINQDYQALSSATIRDSLSFVIKGPNSAFASCSFNSQTYSHGASVPGYSVASVPFGQLCSSVAVSGTCNDGVISNQPAFGSCSVQAASTCSFNSQTYNHGDSIPGFSASSVPFGQQCSSVAVSGTCNNGVITNQPASASCSVDAAQSCLFNSQTYAHGASVPGFSAASVSFGQECSSVAVSGTCNNGIVSNQPAFASCSVDAGLTCTIDSQVFQPNDPISGYIASSVYAPSTCGSAISTYCDGTTGLPNNALVTSLSCNELAQPGVLTLDLSGASFKIANSSNVVVSSGTNVGHLEVNLPVGSYTIYIPGKVSVSPPKYTETPVIIEQPAISSNYCKSALGNESFSAMLNNEPGYYCEFSTTTGSNHVIDLNSKVKNGYGVLIDGESANQSIFAQVVGEMNSQGNFINGVCVENGLNICGTPDFGAGSNYLNWIFGSFTPNVGHNGNSIVAFNQNLKNDPEVIANVGLNLTIKNVGNAGGFIPVSHSPNLQMNVASVNSSNSLGAERLHYAFNNIDSIVFSVIKLDMYNGGCQDPFALNYDPKAETSLGMGDCSYQNWIINWTNNSGGFYNQFTSSDSYAINGFDSNLTYDPLFGGPGTTLSFQMNYPMTPNTIYFQSLDAAPTNVKCKKTGTSTYYNTLLTYINSPMNGYKIDLPNEVLANPIATQEIDCVIE